jgi:hypothetical protein
MTLFWINSIGFDATDQIRFSAFAITGDKMGLQ